MYLRKAPNGRAAPQLPPVQAYLLGPGDTRRTEHESFIHDVFARIYQADVRHYMPTLMGLRTEDGDLMAALGLRFGAEGRLFLECYLDAPVEAVMSRSPTLAGVTPNRERIVEVGNLAAVSAGGTRSLIIALAAYLQGAAYDWVVFTAVPSLANSFRRLGLGMIELGEARRERLPAEERARWGRYYEGRPRVVAVNVPHTYGVLERTLRLPGPQQTLARVWGSAFAEGLRHTGTVPVGSLARQGSAS